MNTRRLHIYTLDNAENNKILRPDDEQEIGKCGEKVCECDGSLENLLRCRTTTQAAIKMVEEGTLVPDKDYGTAIERIDREITKILEGKEYCALDGLAYGVLNKLA